jgi:hypothetical protein
MSFNPEFQACQKLVSMFCESPSSWPNEIKTAKKLLKLSPDIEAWKALHLPYKINSLLYFLTPEGKDLIPSSKENPYLLDLDRLV